MPRFLHTLIVVALVVSACSGSGDNGGGETVLLPDGSEVTSVAGTDPAPEFPDGLDWLNVDRPLSMAELRGKVVILDFWTYGCINCIHIIPDLKRLEAEYSDELVVIGVHSAKFENEGDTENIRNVIARYGLEHPVVNDRDFQVWRQWGANAWPTVVLIDPAGNIVGGHSGEGIYPIFQPAVESLVVEFDAKGLLDRDPIDLAIEQPPSTVLSFPGKVLVDAPRNRLFVADTNHHRVIVADLTTGEVTGVVGSGARGFEQGSFTEAEFDQPQGMALSADGSALFVADVGNHAIRSIDLDAGSVTVLLGTGSQASTYPPFPGVGPEVSLTSPWDVLLEGDILYIAMAGSHQIWQYDFSNREVIPIAGSGREGVDNGAASRASLAQPSGLASDGAGRVFFADSESSSIRYVDTVGDREVGLLAGTDASLFDFGDVDGVGADVRLQHPLGVVYAEGFVYITDTYNSKIKQIDPATGATTSVAGGAYGWRDGVDPLFYEPGGLDYADGRLYIADTNNHVIRVYDLATGEASTLVLFGIEAFAAPDEELTTITLDSVTVAPGMQTMTIDVELPAGYVFNDLAPFTLSWSGEGLTGDPSAGDVRIVHPEFPVEATLAITGGSGTLIGEMTTYFCTEATKDLCLIDRVKLVIPVTVMSGADSDIGVGYQVPPPG